MLLRDRPRQARARRRPRGRPPREGVEGFGERGGRYERERFAIQFTIHSTASALVQPRAEGQQNITNIFEKIMPLKETMTTDSYTHLTLPTIYSV